LNYSSILYNNYKQNQQIILNNILLKNEVYPKIFKFDFNINILSYNYVLKEFINITFLNLKFFIYLIIN